MRSIHKKTLKRFLSTLLAVVMVLGMVPLTALAAPPYVTLEQSDFKATIDPSEPAAVTDGNQSTVTYNVMIEATATTAGGKTVSLSIDGMNYDFGTVTVDSSGAITGFANSAPLTEFIVTAAGKISGTVTKDYAPGDHTVEMYLTVGSTTSAPKTATITVPRKADLTSLTATPDEVTVGQDFTVMAKSDINNGFIEFTYNGVSVTAPVMPRPDGTGYATHTFTAVADKDTVTAKQFGMSGGVVDSDEQNATIAVNAATVYHTITYSGNSLDAYNVPAPETVAAGTNYNVTAAVPNRTGYTFVGWAETATATATDVITTISGVGADITLYAVWAEETVAITWNPAPTGVSYVSAYSNTANKGSTVRFALTLAGGYDPNTLVVTANNVPLAPVKDASNKYWYQFTATAATTVDIAAPSLKTFVVALPTGGNFTASFTAPSSAVNYSSTTVSYDTNNNTTEYAFKIEPIGHYTVEKVFVNGFEVTPDTGVYSVKTVTSEQSIRVVMEEVVFHTVTYVTPTSMIERQVQHGTTFSDIALGTVTVEGHNFSGWCSDPACNTPVGTSATVTTDMTVYGKYVPKTYSITYDMNEATYNPLTGLDNGGITATTKTFGQTVALSAVVPTATNYVFKGWATSATGPAVYQPGDSYSAESDTYTDVELFAVWEKKTFTINLSSGVGCSLSPSGSYTVEYGDDLTVDIVVERAYAATAPAVTVDGSTPVTLDGTSTTNSTGSTSDNSAAAWTYTLENITADHTVLVTATKNEIHTVNFYAVKNGNHDTDPFLAQSVEHGYYATQPAAPAIEGFTFEGWYQEEACSNKFNFGAAILVDTNVYAKYTAITSTVTLPEDDLADNGWWISFGTTNDSDAVETVSNVAYKAEKTFYIFVADGYDATNMQVAANGYKLAPVTDAETVTGGKLYTFTLYNITEDQTVTVTGVVRKTVTITYNANARDDVSDMPVQQVVNYYLSGASGNSKIIKQIPVRTGYEFLGWCTDSAYTGTGAVPSGETYYAKAAIEAGADSVFTTDTTLYAIWEASELTVDLTFDGDYKYDDSSNSGLKPGLDYFYEGDTIALKATLSANAQGTMTFYQMAYDEYDSALGAANAWEVIGTASINGGKVGSVTTVVAPYEQDSAGTTAKQSNYRWVYKVEFEPTGDEGYVACADADDIRIYSKAISWNITKPYTGAWTNAENELSIYKSDGATTVTQMEANTVYYLQIPMVVELDGGRVFNGLSKKLTVGEHYVVDWEYKDANNDWVHYTTITDSDRVKVEAQYSQYSFRAKVTPAANSIYTKAAKYDAGTVVADAYMDYLITEPTAAVVTKNTTTTLVIVNTDGKLTEAANVVINGDNTVFTADHLAQFEGQTVTLTATVVETVTSGTAPAVASGSVEFYQNGTLIATVPVETAGGNMGKASCTATMTAFTGTDATAKKDTFYAKYVANATYAESTSATSDVYIKSTTIKTPVIMSEQEGKIGTAPAYATTYNDNLTDLLAGVEHKFTLRETGAEATGLTSDWSVVALDGRTVDDSNYDIQWNVKTGDNTETSTTVGGTFTTSNNKVGDEISVTLIAKNDMKVDATSKKAIIGTKQDVNVTVTASDKIASTTDTDVYQLNEITLTATVAAKETDATVKPSGTVTFYYSVNGTAWTKVGETTDLAEVAGVITASITTDKLPVAATTNTKQNVTITAIYSGDETFKTSGTISSGAITDTAGCTVTDETVTVYSSVVLVYAAEENKAVTSLTNGGIHISPNGALKANNADVTLTLSDIYTLDHATEDHTTTPDLSKLKFNTDYTVQWWKLENANACKDPGTTDSYALTSEWEKINGATNINYTIDMVPQNVAYRAEITVTGTPITKGSDTEVVQAVAGRRVYYSNVLVVGDGMLTVTTNITTSDNKAFNEEGIVKGETVTIHTLVAGATGSAPVCKLEATVKSVTDPSKSFTITADGGSYTSDGYCALTWDTAAAAVTPGYYTLKVTATSNNGYESQDITRELIVRDNQYTLTVDKDSKVYNGKAQGIEWKLDGVDIENTLAQNSVVVYYYQNGKMVEPTQAGEYTYELYLPASAYWTETDISKDEGIQHITGTFTIKPRPVNVVDLVAQAKVYDGTTDINELEVILNDSEIDGDGAATGDTGIINGDSIYATGVMTIDAAGAGNRTLSVSNVTLHGDDVKNYVVGSTSYTESINVQRSQVKGDIANSTYKYTGSNITVPASDIYLIDQAGNVLSNYTVTYYYHNGDGVEKVDAMNKLGKYTVIARPEQTNYKGGASQTIYVADSAVPATVDKTAVSTLINISDTVTVYNPAGNAPYSADVTNDAYTVSKYYQNGTDWSMDVPANAGRYLIKVVATNGTKTETAYGIYTIVKARPELTLTANNATYTSGQINGYGTLTGDNGAEVYYTWTGGTIKGVSYTAPTDAGNYVVTAHVGETDNFTAHEVSANFTIAKAPLTIDADELVRMQYESYPDMVATFKGLVGSAAAPDTSLRDVQIQPEFIFNEKNGGYTNAALDQVGADYPITVRNALSRNYEITYVGGNMAVNAQDANADLAIHGMIDNAKGGNIAYYGDEIQLYAYGNYGQAVEGTGTRHNTSSLLKWSLSTGAPATIDPEDGLLKITDVGTFTVTLTRGTGTAAISTSIEIEALKKEVKVNVPDEDKVYDATTQTYTEGNMKAYDEKFNDVTATIASGNTTRENIGSQIVTGKVADSVADYQSETYGGLFTINDKEVTVAPVEQTKVYGTKEAYEVTDTTTDKAYSETGVVGGKTALTTDGNNKLGVVASVSDLYENIDVSSTGYEILVAGPENMNYNVKYTTAAAAATAKVTAKPLDVSTGTLNNNIALTSGSRNPLGDYPVNGAEVNASATLGASNVRMYGEPNWVMDYALATLVDGDSLADLALDSLAGNLVKFNYNIGANANITYPTRTSTPPTHIGSLTAYPVDTDASMIAFGNYTESYNKGTQNIYQRPVTLKLANSQSTLDIYYSEILTSVGAIDTDKLLKIIINNVEAGKYNDGTNYVGGLAELLKHTVKDLDLRVTTNFAVGARTFTATVTVGNPNYWLGNDGQKFDIAVNILSQRLTVDYTTFTATFSDVVLYQQSETTRTPDYATGDVTFKIYRYVEDKENYSYYAANEATVFSGTMTKDTSRTGRYYVTYPKLSAGTYRVFAVASGYTIID